MTPHTIRQLRTRDAFALYLASADQPVSIAQIQRYGRGVLGLSRQGVHWALRALRRAGRLTRIGLGLYRWVA